MNYSELISKTSMNVYIHNKWKKIPWRKKVTPTKLKLNMEVKCLTIFEAYKYKKAGKNTATQAVNLSQMQHTDTVTKPFIIYFGLCAWGKHFSRALNDVTFWKRKKISFEGQG